MKILGIDTSSSVLSIGITNDDHVLGEFTQNKALTHSERLMPHIAYLMEAVDETAENMDYFAVTVGPGSFTGIRIGVATANAFGLAHGKKVIEISTLEALAENFILSDAIIISTMYAQRDDYYRGIYTFEKNGDEKQMIILQTEAALSRTEIIEEAKNYSKEKTVIFVGEITKALDQGYLTENISANISTYPVQIADFTDNYIRPAVLCKMARQKITTAQKYARPVYIRKPQAEVEYEERHGAIEK